MGHPNYEPICGGVWVVLDASGRVVLVDTDARADAVRGWLCAVFANTFDHATAPPYTGPWDGPVAGPRDDHADPPKWDLWRPWAAPGATTDPARCRFLAGELYLAIATEGYSADLFVAAPTEAAVAAAMVERAKVYEINPEHFITRAPVRLVLGCAPWGGAWDAAPWQPLDAEAANGVAIASLGGRCPVQAEGTVDGVLFGGREA